MEKGAGYKIQGDALSNCLAVSKKGGGAAFLDGVYCPATGEPPGSAQEASEPKPLKAHDAFSQGKMACSPTTRSQASHVRAEGVIASDSGQLCIDMELGG